MNFKGIVRQITPLVSGTSASGKEWTKQQVLVEEINTEHPNSIVFEAFNKPIDGIVLGVNVDVEFNAKYSEYQGKLYNSFQIYTIKKVFTGASKSDSSLSVPNPHNQIDSPGSENDNTDDMPF
jgi:hypothetical protein